MTGADIGTERPRGWFRWWFENRTTGDITIAQSPNWPLFAIGGAWVLRQILDSGTPHDLLGWATRGLWFFWGGDEIVRGVNPWRRALGTAVVAWQVIGLWRS